MTLFMPSKKWVILTVYSTIFDGPKVVGNAVLLFTLFPTAQKVSSEIWYYIFTHFQWNNIDCLFDYFRWSFGIPLFIKMPFIGWNWIKMDGMTISVIVFAKNGYSETNSTSGDHFDSGCIN